MLAGTRIIINCNRKIKVGRILAGTRIILQCHRKIKVDRMLGGNSNVQFINVIEK